MQLWEETEKFQKRRIVNSHRHWLAFHGEMNYGEGIDSKDAVEKNVFFPCHSAGDHTYECPSRQSFNTNMVCWESAIDQTHTMEPRFASQGATGFVIGQGSTHRGHLKKCTFHPRFRV